MNFSHVIKTPNHVSLGLTSYAKDRKQLRPLGFIDIKKAQQLGMEN